jgi:hypothetical protein
MPGTSTGAACDWTPNMSSSGPDATGAAAVLDVWKISSRGPAMDQKPSMVEIGGAGIDGMEL